MARHTILAACGLAVLCTCGLAAATARGHPKLRPGHALAEADGEVAAELVSSSNTSQRIPLPVGWGGSGDLDAAFSSPAAATVRTGPIDDVLIAFTEGYERLGQLTEAPRRLLWTEQTEHPASGAKAVTSAQYLLCPGGVYRYSLVSSAGPGAGQPVHNFQTGHYSIGVELDSAEPPRSNPFVPVFSRTIDGHPDAGGTRGLTVPVGRAQVPLDLDTDRPGRVLIAGRSYASGPADILDCPSG